MLVHVEQFEDKSVALKREFFLKTFNGGSKLIEFLKARKMLNKHGLIKTEQYSRPHSLKRNFLILSCNIQFRSDNL